jgi:hypothetical protein
LTLKTSEIHKWVNDMYILYIFNSIERGANLD